MVLPLILQSTRFSHKIYQLLRLLRHCLKVGDDEAVCQIQLQQIPTWRTKHLWKSLNCAYGPTLLWEPLVFTEWRSCQVLHQSKLQSLPALFTHLVYSCVWTTNTARSCLLYCLQIIVSQALRVVQEENSGVLPHKCLKAFLRVIFLAFKIYGFSTCKIQVFSIQVLIKFPTGKMYGYFPLSSK